MEWVRSSNVYRTIDEIPMMAFLYVLCDGAMENLYKGNKIPDNPNEEAEKLHFQQLYFQYADRLSVSGRKMDIEKKIIVSLYSKIVEMEAIIIIMASTGNVPEAIRDVVKSYGVSLCGDIEKDTLRVYSAKEREVFRYKKAIEAYNRKLF